MVDDPGVVLEIQLLAHAPGDLVEVLGCGVVEVDLGLDAPQERLVDQGLGVEVGRERHHHVEGNLDLLAARECQDVDVAIERDHPAVEQLLGTDALAPEVVDDEQAVVGLHLERRGIVLRARIVLEIQHLHRQLAADHDARPFAQDPPAVRFTRRLARGALVDVRIVDGDDLTVDLDGVRHPHRVAIEHLPQRLGDGGLAGPRRTVEEDRLPGHGRGAELVERLVADHEVRERLLQLRRMNLHAAHGLRLDALDVVVERDGSGSGVLTLRQQLERAHLAFGRGHDPVNALDHTGHLQELLLPQALEDLLDDLHVDLHVVRELPQGELTHDVEGLEREIFEKLAPQAELYEVGFRVHLVRCRHGPVLPRSSRIVRRRVAHDAPAGESRSPRSRRCRPGGGSGAVLVGTAARSGARLDRPYADLISDGIT